MKKIFLLLIPFLIASGCKNRNTFTVIGTLKSTGKEYIYLNRVNIDKLVLVDSSRITGKGRFRFRVNSDEPDFYQVGYPPEDFVTLLAGPDEKIELDFRGTRLSENYAVTGSEGSEQIQILDLMLLKTKNKLDSLSNLYKNSEKEPDFETKKKHYEEEYLRLVKEQRKFNIGFIIKNITSLSAIKALYQRIDDNTYVLYESRDLQYLKIVSDSLKRHYPNSKHTKALISDFSKEMNQFYARQLEKISASLPETKIDPDLQDINGKRVKLSSLKGKYVLLSFWSANSRECIAENLQLKEFYRIYNKKGFEIYQIALDEDESAWKAAVKFDELPWINTREDDPSNPTNARLYNVKTLPTNYLYDPDGNIIASNLHGKFLQIKLNQLFNN
jgi:cytochrome oxidase Cu insertion factor (SCO1/SenC/PrrC family)